MAIYINRREGAERGQRHSVCGLPFKQLVAYGIFIVSITQTACSALLRGFEPRYATGRRFVRIVIFIIIMRKPCAVTLLFPVFEV